MSLILGLDEVGRGAWAGPLAIGAVVFDSAVTPDGLKDSKKLTKRQRENLNREIKSQAIAIGIGFVDAPTIDNIGLSAALKLAANRAFFQISADICSQIDQIIIDGTIKLLDDSRVTTLVKADDKIASVSAAAITAKVARDHYMSQLDKVFPDYHFSRHVGYGTSLHSEKISQFGVLNGIHRESFAPIAKVLKGNSQSSYFNSSRNFNVRQNRGKISRNLGYESENIAANFLVSRGHKIIARNWKTKFCEIDIISICEQTLFFTEVKYRENAFHGNGLDAITPKKLAKMRKAVEIFIGVYSDFYKNFDIKISAISLHENPPKIDKFIENIY